MLIAEQLALGRNCHILRRIRPEPENWHMATKKRGPTLAALNAQIVGVDAHRQRFGAEPICKALQVAPSAYWRETARERQPSLCPPRLQREAALMP